MKTTKLIDRFRGEDGMLLLEQALMAQWLIGQDKNLAHKIATVSDLHELALGEILIRQGDADNDIYFILVGSLRVQVNQRDIATRAAGYHLGEMALIDPSMRRTATNVAYDQP